MTKSAFGSGYSYARKWIVPASEAAPPFIKILLGSVICNQHNRRKWLRAMKLTALLLTVGFLNVYAGGTAQSVSFSGKNAPLKTVFSAIEKQTGFVVFSNADFFQLSSPVTLNVQNMPLLSFLDLILSKQPFTYQVQNKTISLVWRGQTPSLLLLASKPPPVKITGTVRGTDNQPLQGATVVLKGTNRSVATNAKGIFELHSDNENNVLVISFIGYKTMELPVKGQPETALTITLIADASQLGDVTVVSTGYQFIPKDRATGAFATISSKDLENRTSRDLVTLMEGLTPGFVVQYQGNGLVNEDPQIMMRGVSTFGSTQPLIVVDGFPIEGSISSINPNDVARITFLRDAAAAAIWGVKASNGVIVIDTKKGSTVTPKVSFRSNLTMMEKPSLSYLNRLGSADLVDLETQMFNAGNASRSDYAGPMGAYSQVVGVLFDHKDGLIDDAERDKRLAALAAHDNRAEAANAFFANNYVQDNTISFSGSPNTFMNYYASVGYTNGSGLYKGDGRKQTNVNFNTELKVTKNLKMNVGFNYSALNTDRSPLKSFSNLGVDIPYVLTLLPYERFYQPDGSPARIARKYSPEFNNTMMNMGYYDAGYYPADDWKNYDFNTKDNNLRFQSTLAYKINKMFTFQGGFKSETGFSTRSDLSREQGYATRSLLNRFAAQNQNGKLIFNLPKGDWLQEANGRTSNYYVRGQLDMDHTFKKHPGRINALVGTEWQRTQMSNTTDTRFGYGASSGLSFPVDQNMLLNFYNPALTESMRFDYSSYYNKAISDDRYVSYYFNGTYEYDARYAFSASARVNKSSRFDASAGLNKEVLGSLGLKWTVSQEKFMQHANWVDKLAVRFTTGMTGNVPGFTYSPYHTSAFNSLSTLTNTFTLQVLNQPNKHLKWESSLTNNLGFDFSFGKGRIAGMLDLYHKKTNDLLGVQMIDPSLIGRFLIQQNIADMTNKGIELQLNTVNLKTRDWVWRTNVNASYNKNTVNKVTGNYGAIVQRVAQVESYPANSLWAYRWAGLSKTGVPQYFDNQNGKDVVVTSTGSLSINDLKHIGSITPVYSVGLMNAFGYKGWEFSFLFMTNGGHYLQTDNYSESISTSDLFSRDIVFMAPVAALKDRWKVAGDETKTNIPAYGQSFGYNYTDIKYQSATWIKLREVVLSYLFTKKQFAKLPVQDLKISLQGRNLWRWVANDAGIDPEAYKLHQGYRTLPIVAGYSFNVQVNF